MQGKLSVPGSPTNLNYRRARAYCACSKCGWGFLRHFFSRLSFLISFSLFSLSLSLSLSLGDGLIEILSQRTVKPITTKQPT